LAALWIWSREMRVYSRDLSSLEGVRELFKRVKELFEGDEGLLQGVKK